MLMSKEDARGIESATRFIPPELVELVECVELTAQGSFQQKVDVLLAAVGLMQLHNEWRVRHAQDGFLVHDALLHPSTHNVSLADRLQRIGRAKTLLLWNSMFDEFHSGETARAKQADDPEIFLEDLVSSDFFRVFVLFSLSHFGCVLDDRLQRSHQKIKRRLVQHEALGQFGGDLHRGHSQLPLQQCPLTEERKHSLGRIRSQGYQRPCPFLDDVDRALDHHIKRAAKITLLHDEFPFAKVNLHQRLGQFFFLVSQQWAKHRHAIEILDELLLSRLTRDHHNLLEAVAVDDPNPRLAKSCHGRFPRLEVEEGQLTEAPTRVHYFGHPHHGLVTRSVCDLNLELPLLDDVEVFCLQRALNDDLVAFSHFFLPHLAQQLFGFLLGEREDA
mmetsp:Transcript_6016/g.9625  ORF Transcript_6016/g.9625 Transcript_6016/m.9625 type:complete len:389 (-) Transcript_6016:851-2017(-)